MIASHVVGSVRWRLLLASFLVLAVACQNQEVEENRILAEDVMTVHDEAMAKMTQMHELRLQLEGRAGGSGPDPEIGAAIEALQQAHRQMMTWMREYRPPQSDEALQQAGDYLLDERRKIQLVSDAIAASIDRAERLLVR
ncbi:hypothetical protein [Desulfofustis glycolicus]|uniref:Lipoprotein n=1 Tax=Desulfofustis glycolicus DSM 9705 TaxID=1121409 RepID=A0A1M5V7E4_9BACT|nr:hypothetical protein [Desulfofustis glycolicus]MCB2214931.1 hypothetical protein [Desulfobulbaceae bacterium]SHH71145.1 hypothetical protein SAMN02745124_01548 [Desulfofustis glycolicus DSM 9705]